MTEGEDRSLAEDFACPVEIEAGADRASPGAWDWTRVGTSKPNQATFHMSHSDVSRVIVDVLRTSDSPPDAPFVVFKDIPIIVIDSLDKYWAGESRTQLPLHGVRVPVEGDTLAEAKQALAKDLSAQLRLLLLLASSHKQLAPGLRENLGYLRTVLAPRPGLEQKD